MNKKTPGRKPGHRNAHPVIGSVTAAIVDRLISDNFVCASDTARDLQCSVEQVLYAIKRWGDYIEKQKKLRTKTLRDDENV